MLEYAGKYEPALMRDVGGCAVLTHNTSPLPRRYNVPLIDLPSFVLLHISFVLGRI